MTLAEEIIDVLQPKDAPISKTYAKHSTIYDFLNASKQFFGGKNIFMAPSVRIFDVDMIPFLGTKMLVIRSEAKGLAPNHSETSEHHVQIIRFMGVHFSEGPQDGYLEASSKRMGQKFWFKPVWQKVNPCDVYCSCKDFQFRFSYYIDSRFHALATTLTNEIKNYKRKTPPPPKGRPYVNPGHLPGMCKHLLRLTDTLIDNKVLR